MMGWISMALDRTEGAPLTRGDWAALRTRPALLLDHHTTTKTTPLMWWKGIMQGLRLTSHSRTAQRGPGAVGQAVASAQFRHDETDVLHSTTALNQEETDGRGGGLGWISNSA